MIARIDPSWIMTVNTPSGIVEADQVLADQQVRGRGYREELGESLDDAEESGLNRVEASRSSVKAQVSSSEA